MKLYNVAIVGATGAVGQEMIKTLEQRDFPVKTLLPLASKRSAGKKIQFKDQEIEIQELKSDSFTDIDIALFSAGGSISEEFCPHAVEAGAICIDNTSAFRMDKEVPLVVPEVNPDDIKWNKGIIANPNCSTIQMVVPLKPIHDNLKIKRIVVSTYQAVSGAGAIAIDELKTQTKNIANNEEIEINKFPYQIAGNLIPHIDVFEENGYTKEETKMIKETKKIFGDDSIKITATTVRVPVIIAHSESVNIETEKYMEIDELKDLLSNFPGITLCDDTKNNKYPMPLDIAGKDDVYVGRIRKDESVECGYNLWIVADNLRKGAALNAVQIAELVIND
jgi:aspartate-semialdehyde dehydrogenase